MYILYICDYDIGLDILPELSNYIMPPDKKLMQFRLKLGNSKIMQNVLVSQPCY